MNEIMIKMTSADSITLHTKSKTATIDFVGDDEKDGFFQVIIEEKAKEFYTLAEALEFAYTELN